MKHFFGAIRSHGWRNINPTPERFESALTTLLVNSLSSVHSHGANCEEDQCNALHALVVTKSCEAATTGDIFLDIINEITLTPLEEKTQPQVMGPLKYVSGYFFKKSKNISPAKFVRVISTAKRKMILLKQGNIPVVVGFPALAQFF